MDDFLKINRKKVVLYVFWVAFLLVGVSIAMRYWYYQGIPIGNEAYFHMRMAESLANGGVFSFNPFHWLLAGFGLLLGVKMAAVLLQVGIGALLLWLLLKLLRDLKFDESEQLTVGLLFVLSPMFIRFTATLNVHFFTLMLILAGAYFWVQKKFLLMNVMVVFAVLSSVYAGLVVLVLMVSYYAFQRDIKILYSTLVAVLVFGLSREFLPVFAVNKNIFADFISDLGANFGFSVYVMLLAAIGFILAWRARSKFTFINVFTLVTLTLALTWNLAFNVFLLIPVCILASNGILHLINREWEVAWIRNLILVILAAGIVVSGVGGVIDVVDGEPGIDTYESLLVLKHHAQEGDIVFADFEKSEWIKGVAGLDVVNDFAGRNEQETERVFLSRSFGKVVDYFAENDVRYVWVDSDTIEKFSLEKGRGFLLFLENEDNFEQVYSNDEAELWKFVGVRP